MRIHCILRDQKILPLYLISTRSFPEPFPLSYFINSLRSPYQHLTGLSSYNVKSQVHTDILSQETLHELKSNIVILKLMIFPSKLSSPSSIFCHTSYTSKALITQAHTSWMSLAWCIHITSAAVRIFFVSARLFLLSVQPNSSEVAVTLKMIHGIIRQKCVIKIKSPQSYD